MKTVSALDNRHEKNLKELELVRLEKTRAGFDSHCSLVLPSVDTEIMSLNCNKGDLGKILRKTSSEGC